MSKILRKIVFLICIVFLGFTSFGFSYFYFEYLRTQEVNIDNSGFNVDDIKENYSFNETAVDDKTYTLYFFPSAAYMHLYESYLDDKTNVAKPEEQFGYKEVQYNEVGNILLDSNGNTIYKLSDETGKYDTDSNVTYDGAYRKYIGVEFSCNYFEADGTKYYAYSSDGAYMQTQNNLTAVDGYKRTWGVPNEEFNIKTGDSNRVENYNGHNQYSLDRLGCWDDCYYYGYTVSDGNGDLAPRDMLIEGDYPSLTTLDDTNTGRYLPIKVTVTNTMSTSIMEKAIQDIFTSMGNGYGIHNYSFVEWTYVKDPNGTYTLPYSGTTNNEDSTNTPVGEAFQPIPTDTYFDMFSNLSEYADSEGVIRLFPLFSNGKKTGATTYTTGGGAANKLTIGYSDGSDNTYKYPFFTSDVYNDGDGYFSYTDETSGSSVTTILESQYIRLFRYNNIEITKENNINSLLFSADYLGGSKKPTCGVWQGEFRFQYQIEDVATTLLENYGEGLYSFYVFVANYSYQQGTSWSDYPTSSNQFPDTFDGFYENIVSQAVNGKFSTLKNKQLNRIEVTDNYLNDFRSSPTVVAFEKVDELKAINDIEVDDSSDELSSDNLDSFIKKQYEYSDGFYSNSSSIYEATYDEDTSKYSIVGDEISSSNPYIYVAKNVDFINDDSLYFMITFSESYSEKRKFSTTNTYDYLATPTVNTDETTGETTYTFSPEDIYTDAYQYVEQVSVTSESKTYNLFKFKSKDVKGIYDILIKYNSTSNEYEMYMFRHSNLFCYVFDGPLSDYSSGNFVDHDFDETTYINEASGATLLFENKYFLGESIKESDISTSTNKGKTLDEILRNKIGGSTTYSGADLLNYNVIDRVTGAIVAKYEENNGEYSLKCDFIIQKNYIFYLNEIN